MLNNKQETEVDRPVAFQGSNHERALNIKSHIFQSNGEEVRCRVCDCRYGSRTSDYRCLSPIPREVVRYIYTDQGTQTEVVNVYMDRGI